MVEVTELTEEEAEAIRVEATRQTLTERRNAAAAEYVAAQTALRGFERTDNGGSMIFVCKCGERIVLPFINLD